MVSRVYPFTPQKNSHSSPTHHHPYRNQLSDIIGDTWNGTASLKIDNADDNLRLLNFINSETFFNLSCYETGQ